jgi:cytoskeletal protein RodZ
MTLYATGDVTMDNFELKPEKSTRPAKRSFLIWNLLTVVVLLSVCCLAYYFLTIFQNPGSVLNPFPPQPTITVYRTETSTATIRPLEPTWTYTPTIAPSPTRTKAPTWTLLPEMITPTITKTPTITPTEGTPTITNTPMPASAEITYQASTTIHADSACKWLGVGGEVFDKAGKPVAFQTVQLGGTLNGKAVSDVKVSGNAAAYGVSGFEFVLGDLPIASTQTLWIQLFDNTGKALTEKIYFDTFTDCNQNLVMVKFTKTR